jgi:predicted lipoprotein with Yx(FWY)xxD motif
MTRSRCINFFARAAIVPLAALAVAGYGSALTAAGASTAPQKATKGKSATVRVEKTNLGKILVNSKGRTLYLFQADQGTTSACNDACAVNWPPLENAAPKAGKGAKSSLLTTSTRADGKTQVVYNGHPLYTFQADTKAGNTNGQGVNAFGGLWYAVSSAGNAVTKQPSSSTSSGGGTPGY